MSTYQYYEFLAIDRPLDEAEQAAIRSLSTRARITATSFVNEYHWGDFGGDPFRLMERYYDAHLYLANWGTRRVTLRLPSDLLDPAVAGQYCVDERLGEAPAGRQVRRCLGRGRVHHDQFQPRGRGRQRGRVCRSA